MKIAIDARIHDGVPGGIQQTILGLARGLGELPDGGADEYHFLVLPDHGWLRPALTGPCRALVVSEPRRGRVERSLLGRRNPALARTVGHVVESRGRLLPAADPALECAGVDLVHFMQQRGFRTDLPNIYQPHDLQHVYHPEFFHPLQRAYRHRSYRAMARQADRVGVMTAAAREDVGRHLGVDPDRVIVVPWASVLASGEPADATLPAGCPPRYLLYPAQTWPHKNHLGLVEALRELRGQHRVDVPVVFTGRRTEHFAEVLAAARNLGVDDLLHHLGFVGQGTLHALYDAAVALVFPSLYEGWGLPLVEAFTLGTPVCCSDISPLREVAGPAARRFDPRSPASMAAVISTVWTDEAERALLIEAGRARAELFTWPRSAELFRAHYRDVLGLPRTPRDDALLSAPAIV